MYTFNLILYTAKNPKLFIESLPILRKDHYSNGLSGVVGFRRKKAKSLDFATILDRAFLLLPKPLIRSEVHFEVTPSIRSLQVGALVKEGATEKRRRDDLSLTGIQKCKLFIREAFAKSANVQCTF